MITALWTPADVVTEIRTRTKLTVLATAAWPDAGRDGAPAPVAGFIVSSFAALVADVAGRCLTLRHGTPPVPAAHADRTAIVLVSAGGDMETAAAVADAVDNGRRLSPLLFFQSVPNSVLGWVTTRWGLTGTFVCISPAGGPVADAVAAAELLVEDGEADEVLLILVEQACADEPDQATAVLLCGHPAESPMPAPWKDQGVST
jgi:3-oxoacyl-(acyl-carrier-protein) synthase